MTSARRDSGLRNYALKNPGPETSASGPSRRPSDTTSAAGDEVVELSVLHPEQQGLYLGRRIDEGRTVGVA